MKSYKNRKNYIKAILFIFTIMNRIAFFHSYKFTHFREDKSEKMSFWHNVSDCLREI